MNGEEACTQKESRLSEYSNKLNGMLDKVNNSTKRTAAFTDKLLGSEPKCENDSAETPNPNGELNVFYYLIDTLDGRINSLQNEIDRLVNSGAL